MSGSVSVTWQRTTVADNLFYNFFCYIRILQSGQASRTPEPEVTGNTTDLVWGESCAPEEAYRT